jgi:predicted enzyme involved in methoxymalonyl-ACP biosynthesis
VEHAFLGALLRHYRERGCESFLAEFRRTSRNAPAGKVFEEMGFEPLPPAETVEQYRWDLRSSPPVLDYIEVAFERDPTSSIAF